MASEDPIHIKESRKGSFTRAANAHHETDDQFEHAVLAHPGKYSASMRKKAQFAENAKKWHH
jgi:hypothetical protein